MVAHPPSTYGDAFADVYDRWYADRWDPDDAVDALRRLAGDGPVLELGVGTGRLALPLAARGVAVVGVDASRSMLDRLAGKDPGRTVAGVAADLARLPCRPGSFSLVYASHNTLFALADRRDQARCLEDVASLLAPDGSLAVDLFVPGLPPPGRERRADVARVDPDGVVLTLTDRDPRSQVVDGQHLQLDAGGVTLRPWRIRYAGPDEVDELAGGAGLELRWRHADWRGTPFTSAHARHVSVYRRLR